MTTKSYVQDPETGKLVPKSQYRHPQTRVAPDIMQTFEPFTSQIDNRKISNRDALKAHNREHQVTNIQDYGPDWFKRHEKQRQEQHHIKSSEAKQRRRESIIQAVMQQNMR
jgi:hypothetical protein